MIEARHTVSGGLVADFFSGFMLGRAFREIRMHGTPGGDGLPLLVLANHFSWWDGFIQYRLNGAVFDRTLYTMMLEEQLRRHRVLNRCGCFSVRKGTRDAVESLRYCCGLLRDARNAVLLFPQGRIESMHAQRIGFGSGVRYIAERVPGAGTVLNANFADYGPHRKPSLDIYYEVVPPPLQPDSMEELYGDFYKRCRARQEEALWNG